VTLEDFLAQTQADVQAQVSGRLAEGGWLPAEAAFTEVVMNHLAEIGMTSEPRSLHVERRVGNGALRLSGYAVSEEGDQLDLFVSIYSAAETVQPIPDAEIKTAAEQCIRFLGKAVEGQLNAALDPADDAYELILTLQDCYAGLDQIRICILTDRLAKSKSFKPREVSGRSIRLEVFDIERLFRHWSEGKPRDELVVSFEEVCGAPLPCVYIPGETEDYDYALTAIPGAALRLIYERYGARLLEANVRSFLSQTGKVNRGIRETLRDAPERFMAYNNGIVLIADAAELTRASDGSAAIASLSGMQIVNGGQTTASIYFTHRKERGIDLSRVRVPAKIIVLHTHDPEAEETLVSDISRYANSQNAVKVSDLSANKPFHVDLEKLAQTVYLPDGIGRWFYERAAGSYNVMLAREGTTPARLKAIRDAVPTSRKVIKTDLAKYRNAWDGHPDLVALGNQKNFELFMAMREEQALPPPTASDYKRMIAQAILFKAVQKVVRSASYLASQANIVAYTVALMGHAVRDRISLDLIWQRQGLSRELVGWAGDMAKAVDIALRRSAGGRQVSEWAKKPECWEELRETRMPEPPASAPELQA
jgi:hypothetical protein